VNVLIRKTRSRLPRLTLVLLASAVLALGTVAIRPQPAAAAVPAGAQTEIALTALRQVGQGACPSGFGTKGYTFKSSVTSFYTCHFDSGWCAIFAGWVWQTNGVYMKALTYTPDNWPNYGTVKATPTKGDAVLFATDPKVKSTIGHIAIVTAVNGTKVTSVGGNQGGVVASLTYSSAPGSSTGLKDDDAAKSPFYVYGYISPLLNPVAPTSVSATLTRTSPLIVTVTWAESSYPDSFTITRNNNTTGVATTWSGFAGTARSYSDGSISSGSYTYTICAYTAVGHLCSSTNISV
jgi:CHAP domain